MLQPLLTYKTILFLKIFVIKTSRIKVGKLGWDNAHIWMDIDWSRKML